MKMIKEFIDGFIKPLTKEGKHSKLIKDGIGNILINVFSSGSNVLLGMLLVRLLGIDGYGIYSFVFSAVVLLYVPSEFGLPNLLIRETAKGLANEDSGRVKGVWKWSTRITGIITATLVILSLIVVFILHDQEVLTKIEYYTFLVGLTIVPFYAFIHLCRGRIQGLNMIILGELPEKVILPLFYSLILLVFLIVPAFQLDPISAMALRLGITIISFVVGIIFVIKHQNRALKAVVPVIEGRKWFNSSVVMALSSGLLVIKNRSNMLLLGFLANSFETGGYQIALNGSIVASIILKATNAVVAPRFSSLYFRGKKEKLQRLVTLHSRFVLLSNVLITIVFIFFGRFILSLLFGGDAVVAYPALLIMLVGQSVNSLVGSVLFLLNMTGHEKQTMWSTGISLAVSLTLNIILIPSFGMIGSAIATSFSMALSQFIMWWLVRKYININSLAFYGGRFREN